MIEEIKDKLIYSGCITIGVIAIHISSNYPLNQIRVFNNNIICRSVSKKIDYHIVLYKCRSNSIVYRHSMEYRANSVRNNHFNKGYYICDHFGEPVNVVCENEHIIVFGDDIERIAWSYIVKYIMQTWAMMHNAVFIKCAAFKYNGQATILIGRGGSGKTVINSVVCKKFGTFITNSNALIKDNKIMGFGSNIRIRNDQFYKNLFEGLTIKEALLSDEFIINPFEAFNCDCSSWIPIRNYIIVNYNTGEYHLTQISPKVCSNIAEQFLLGINVYRLEEDILDYLAADYELFSSYYSQMKNQLNSSITESNCFYADIDINNKNILSEFQEML